MKFRITFKTPDSLTDTIKDELHNMEEAFALLHDQSPDIDHEHELEQMDEVSAAMKKVGEQFINHGEFITVEFDTDTNTATVLKRK